MLLVLDHRQGTYSGCERSRKRLYFSSSLYRFTLKFLQETDLPAPAFAPTVRRLLGNLIRFDGCFSLQSIGRRSVLRFKPDVIRLNWCRFGILSQRRFLLVPVSIVTINIRTRSIQSSLIQLQKALAGGKAVTFPLLPGEFNFLPVVAPLFSSSVIFTGGFWEMGLMFSHLINITCRFQKKDAGLSTPVLPAPSKLRSIAYTGTASVAPRRGVHTCWPYRPLKLPRAYLESSSHLFIGCSLRPAVRKAFWLPFSSNHPEQGPGVAQAASWSGVPSPRVAGSNFHKLPEHCPPPWFVLQT